jgi:hypothetical protein
MAQAHRGQEDGRARSLRHASLLGYHLSQAHGFRVVEAGGSDIGVLESLRYGRHADYPDEIVVRRGRLLRRRRRALPFAAVASVDARARIVTVRLPG